MRSLLLTLLLTLFPSETPPNPAQPDRPMDNVHSGMCDASAALPIGSDRFVVASDEDSVLRVYKAGSSGSLVQEQDFSTVFKGVETDVEGATLLEDGTSYWITSHGRNKDGVIDELRRRFFAMRVQTQGDQVTLALVGDPYTKLLQDLLTDARLKGLFTEDLAKQTDEARAPEAPGGLNIEGLTAWQGGLLIGFRNPIPGGRALLIPLENPGDLLQGKKARFGEPIRLDLGGLGVRSIERLPQQGAYLIVAGPFNDEGTFRLFRWSGVREQPPVEIPNVHLSGLHPEATVFLPGQAGLLLLSDDGEVMIGDKKCKKVKDPNQKVFRSRHIELPAQPPAPVRP